MFLFVLITSDYAESWEAAGAWGWGLAQDSAITAALCFDFLRLKIIISH